MEFNEIIKFITQGDPKLQYHVAGWCYANGEPVQAEYWYKRAAEQGWAEAQDDLGIMYYNGKIRPKDLGLAFFWFEQAAKQGYVDAEFHVGILYSRGEGVEQSDEMALYWYKKAAAQGHAESACNLERMQSRRNNEK